MAKKNLLGLHDSKSFSLDFKSKIFNREGGPSLRIELEVPQKRFFEERIRSALVMLKGPSFLEEGVDIAKFSSSLPLFRIQWNDENPLALSLLLLCRSRANVGKFFYDLVSQWLLPGRRFPIPIFLTTHFRLPDLSDEWFSFSELHVVLRGEEEKETVGMQLPIIEAELCLGAQSLFHAHRILEIKGMSAEEKNAAIQGQITVLVRRRPEDFDYGLFGEMQHFLVMCSEEFKNSRESSHLCRIIATFYLFRNWLSHQMEGFPGKRYCVVKCSSARLHTLFGLKRVMAIHVGMTFLGEHEVFEERHLMKAIQKIVPSVSVIQNSFFTSESKNDRLRMLYIEVEKKDGSGLIPSEKKGLRLALAEELKNAVEHLMRPLFMPRNEEEVMRNIITLSGQLKYVRDFPQMMISFDAQSESEISFTVILVRVLLPDTKGLEELFQLSNTSFTFQPERVRRVGMLRNRYPKEATVFRVKLPIVDFLRADHSVDLFKARQAASTELQRILGEIRDFNGGMIAKQAEAFVMLREQLGQIAAQNELLLENFFHSITPVERRSLIPTAHLKVWFLELLELLAQKEEKRIANNVSSVYVWQRLSNNESRQEVILQIQKEIPAADWVSLFFSVADVPYLGLFATK